VTATATAPLTNRCDSHSRYTVGCTGCRTANTTHKRNRSRLIAYGRWDGRIDATPAREHIIRLGKSGMTRAAVARAASVSSSVVDQIFRGQPTTRANIARSILAVELALADHARVSSLGASRRLQALMANGWDADTLAVELHATPNQVSRWRWRASPTMRHGDHERIAGLYGRIGDRPGPSETARVQARMRGYAPPICFDDEDLDDPNGKPKGFKALKRTSS
jgi:hypothetical protein